MKIDWKNILNVFITSLTVVAFLTMLVEVYIFGYKTGFNGGIESYEKALTASQNENVSAYIPTPDPKRTQKSVSTTTPVIKNVSWGGPDLWTVLNKSRVEHGVGVLNQRDELCTIASIRLNELLALGKLDGHEGFANMAERRPDLKWIFEKYVVAEFLVQGAQTPQEAIDLWLNTLGHKKLITGGEYAYGCVYAQDTFAVAIAAY